MSSFPNQAPTPKKIILSVLDWGLGHAARMVPIIDLLLDEGHSLHLAGSGKSLQWLLNRYPNLPYFSIPAKEIHIPKHGIRLFNSFFIAAIFWKNFLSEKKFSQSMSLSFDIIISDNRYGLSGLKKNRNQVSIIFTHQTQPIINSGFKWIDRKITKTIQKNLSKFDFCLIPDNKDHNKLSGLLSQHSSFPLKTYFIGPLSRFKNRSPALSTPEKIFRYCVILSAQEPYRTFIVNEFLSFFVNSSLQCVIISGTEKYKPTPNVQIHGNPNDVEFVHYLNNSQEIISLSGYSTLMDLYTLGFSAKIFPTPGQKEQEYLCQYHKNGLFNTYSNHHDLLTQMAEDRDA